jgi:hypothetical protein
MIVFRQCNNRLTSGTLEEDDKAKKPFYPFPEHVRLWVV